MLEPGVEKNTSILSHKPAFFTTTDDDNSLLSIYRQEIMRPYINTAYFFLTKNCNLACRYCFERQSEIENSSDGIMSCETFDTALSFFERLIASDPEQFARTTRFSLIFYGGEPFSNKKTLHHAIEHVAAELKSGRLPTQRTKMLVVTNGTLLTDADMALLKAHDVTVTFSLDGDRAASANRVYPDGKTLAWDKATETFRQCKEYGLNLNVACTLSPATIERKEAVLDYFKNVVGATNIGFNLVLDNDIINLGDGSAYDDAAADFVTSAWKFLSAHGIRENRVARRLQSFHPTESSPNYRVYTPGVHRSCRFDCNATGGRQIAIAPDGSVGICHEHIMDKKHFITNIHDKDFNPAESPTYLEWARRSPLFMGQCYDCPAIGICGGGCVINSERKHNDIHRPDSRFCKQTLSILNNILIPSLDK